MLSIIVAVHNQLGHNQLFLEGIRRYTTGPYEVIVIDNHSTDGSAEFFESNACIVIRNKVNLCFPESMNLGIRQAKGGVLLSH
jgi:GT2 family glycosyltransferase